MLSFDFEKPVELVEFTNGPLKELDKIVPDVTIKLTLENNSVVTGMEIWTENKPDVQKEIEGILSGFGIVVKNKPLLL